MKNSKVGEKAEKIAKKIEKSEKEVKDREVLDAIQKTLMKISDYSKNASCFDLVFDYNTINEELTKDLTVIAPDKKYLAIICVYHMFFEAFNLFSADFFDTPPAQFILMLNTYCMKKKIPTYTLEEFVDKVIKFNEFMIKMNADVVVNYADTVLDLYNDDEISKERMEGAMKMVVDIEKDKVQFEKNYEALVKVRQDI